MQAYIFIFIYFTFDLLTPNCLKTWGVQSWSLLVILTNVVPTNSGDPDQLKWLKLPAWKVGDRGFEPRSGIQVS